MNPKNRKSDEEPLKTEDRSTNDKHISLRIPSSLYEQLEQKRTTEGTEKEISPFLRKLLQGAIEQPNRPELQNLMVDINLSLECMNIQLKNLTERERSHREEIDDLKKELADTRQRLEEKTVEVTELVKFIFTEIIDLLVPILATTQYSFTMADEKSIFEGHVVPEIKRLRIFFRNRLRARTGEPPLTVNDDSSAKSTEEAGTDQIRNPEESETELSKLAAEIPF